MLRLWLVANIVTRASYDVLNCNDTLWVGLEILPPPMVVGDLEEGDEIVPTPRACP